MSVLTKEQVDEVARHVCSIAPPLPMSLHTLCDSHEELRAELDETDELNKRLSTILHATANALKGQPEPLHVHSWHDLAEVAQRQRERIAKLVAVVKRLEWDDGYDTCPYCFKLSSTGHAADCALKAALSTPPDTAAGSDERRSR